MHRGDGNVVVYHDGNQIAATNIYDSRSDRLTMQNDGNLVQYSQDGRATWSSGTPGHYGAYLRVQDDCDVVIFERDGRAYWHTNTSGCYEHH
jgi:hypothetical protein